MSTTAVHGVSGNDGSCERADHPAELLGDDHAGTSVDTPLRPDAFVLSDEEKIAAIEPLFGQVLCLHFASHGAASPPVRAKISHRSTYASRCLTDHGHTRARPEG